MASISLPIPNDTNVQPGWIYLREKKSFYPPIDKNKFKTEDTFEIEIKELPQDKLEYLSGIIGNKLWQEDVKDLLKCHTFKIIYCLLTKTKKIPPLQQVNIDFEYVSEIIYGFNTLMLLKYYKHHSISLENIHHILNCKFKGLNVSDYIQRETCSKILSVNIYYEKNFKKESPKFWSAVSAFRELADVMREIRRIGNLEKISANVSTLPPNATNNSESKCLSKKEISKPIRNRSFFRKVFEGVKHIIFWPKYDQVDEESKSSVKELISLVGVEGPKLSDSFPTTTYKDDYCNQHTNSLNNVEKEGNELGNTNSMSNRQSQYDNKNKDAYPDSGTDFKINATTIANNNEDSLKSKTVINDDVTKLASAKYFTGNPTAENKIESKIDQTKLRHQEAETLLPVSNAASDCKESQNKTDSFNDKSSKKNKKCLDSPKDTKKTPPVRKVMLLPARRSDEEIGLSHHYYYESYRDSGEESIKKTLLLFGTDDSGKLSLLNLLFHCSQNDEHLKERPIVDIASKVKRISFYHFLSKGASDKELIIIVTPELKCDVLSSLKQLLSDGILNVNALGFVVNSRSETLTSEERSFFNFIRSSFGEVSNHHLMTFLTFCDFSRNFPVLEEMKHQSIKSKCTLELYTSELGLSNASEQDDLGSALITRELKKAKKVLKTLNDMSLLSVKSMKMAQEKSFADTHRTASFKQLVEELEQFITLVDDGKVITKNVQPIWKLTRLVITLEGGDSSERNLLSFMAKVLSDFSSKRMESKTIPRCFLLLLFNCPDRNFTTTLLSTLDYYKELVASINVNLGVPLDCSVICGNNEVAQYCNNCKDVHLCSRDTSDNNLLHVKCFICKCPAKSHSLWTFQDTSIFYHSFCEMAVSSLNDLFNDLPRQNIVIHFDLFLDCLSKTFPEFDLFLKDITEPPANKIKGKG